jgi:hypothetical protein
LRLKEERKNVPSASYRVVFVTDASLKVGHQAFGISQLSRVRDPPVASFDEQTGS